MPVELEIKDAKPVELDEMMQNIGAKIRKYHAEGNFICSLHIPHVSMDVFIFKEPTTSNDSQELSFIYVNFFDVTIQVIEASVKTTEIFEHEAIVELAHNLYMDLRANMKEMGEEEPDHESISSAKNAADEFIKRLLH